MFKALEELNKTEATPIKIGVGLNTGTCCVGNLGSEQRFNYSAIGDSVNVAARVESLTKQYGLQILITETTAGHVPDLALLEVDLVRVVGRSRAARRSSRCSATKPRAESAEFQALRTRMTRCSPPTGPAISTKAAHAVQDAQEDRARHAPEALRDLPCPHRDARSEPAAELGRRLHRAREVAAAGLRRAGFRRVFSRRGLHAARFFARLVAAPLLGRLPVPPAAACPGGAEQFRERLRSPDENASPSAKARRLSDLAGVPRRQPSGRRAPSQRRLRAGSRAAAPKASRDRAPRRDVPRSPSHRRCSARSASGTTARNRRSCADWSFTRFRQPCSASGGRPCAPSSSSCAAASGSRAGPRRSARLLSGQSSAATAPPRRRGDRATLPPSRRFRAADGAASAVADAARGGLRRRAPAARRVPNRHDLVEALEQHRRVARAGEQPSRIAPAAVLRGEGCAERAAARAAPARAAA